MANVDQGEATADTIGLILHPRLGNPNGVGAGVGNVRRLEPVPVFLDLTGPRTDDPRPSITPVAPTGQGEARPTSESDKVTGIDVWFEHVHILPRSKL